MAAVERLPHRPHPEQFDAVGKPELGDAHFAQQVNWELSALEQADIIVMYLAPGSQSPVSLLELGLHARSGKLIVLCPEGYWRKGNVDAVAARYPVAQVATMDALVDAVRHRLQDRRASPR